MKKILSIIELNFIVSTVQAADDKKEAVSSETQESTDSEGKPKKPSDKEIKAKLKSHKVNQLGNASRKTVFKENNKFFYGIHSLLPCIFFS